MTRLLDENDEGSGRNDTGSGPDEFDEFDLGGDQEDSEATSNNFRSAGDDLFMQNLLLLFCVLITPLLVKVELC